MLGGMRDTDLYEQLLGLQSPWSVARVELDVNRERVDVWAEHTRGEKLRCPECGKECSVRDHTAERVWRHLDSCQFSTFLHARPPRVECAEHGVKQARLPWAEPHCRFTMLFERLVIDVLRETTMAGACRLLGITWDEAVHVMRKAVARGQARKEPQPLKRIGVDEKSARKGHDYMTLVCDLDRGTVEHISDDRTRESLDAFFETQPVERLQAIEAVSMDMWAPYVQSVAASLPEGQSKIVFDRFHIMQHMNEAVDKVRRQEHRLLMEWGDTTLLRSKYLWLYGRENVPDKHLERFADLRRCSLRTGRAWTIKEELRLLWDCASQEAARTFHKRWSAWALRCRLAPVAKVARMVKSHLPNVLSYFTHPITNAMAEGINSVVQTIKKSARGFRNRNNFKTAIFFHCGGLNLYPEYRPTHRLPG